jgi:hypothetical protein
VTYSQIGVDSRRVSEWRTVADAGDEVIEAEIQAKLSEGKAPTKESIRKAAARAVGKSKGKADRPKKRKGSAIDSTSDKKRDALYRRLVRHMIDSTLFLPAVDDVVALIRKFPASRDYVDKNLERVMTVWNEFYQKWKRE